MVLASLILWWIAVCVVGAMHVHSAIQLVQYKKRQEKTPPLLSQKEERILLCGLVVMVLMSRYVIEYVSLFRDDPTAVVSGALVKQYLINMLFALIWPGQRLFLITSIAALATDWAWKRKSGKPRETVHYHNSVFTIVCWAYLVMITTVSFLHHLTLMSTGTTYTFFLFGKCIALVLLLMGTSK